MKVAITGSQGLMGNGLVEIFRSRHEVFALSRADADITCAEAVQNLLARIKPDLVIHAAAIPDLDICESDPTKGFLVNVHGTRNVTEAARQVGAAVAFISSDAVFDGKKNSPYVETDAAIPSTVYGRTKLRGERIVSGLPAHYIFRVSVLFGLGKTNFVEKGLLRIEQGEEYVVASDQLGCATYTLDAARTILDVAEARRFGLYHLANQGVCTRLELAQTAARLAGLDPSKVVGVPSAQMGRKAARLKYAVMEMRNLDAAGFSLPRSWEEALGEYVNRIRASLEGAPAKAPTAS
jgi:dTDP-4-dehydrorhamnose reductase